MKKLVKWTQIHIVKWISITKHLGATMFIKIEFHTDDKCNCNRNKLIVDHQNISVWRPWWRHQVEHFPHYWSFVGEIHRSTVNSPHIGQWRGALMFSLICVWINVWLNNREAGDLRRHRAHYDVTVMPHANREATLLDLNVPAGIYHLDPLLIKTTAVSSIGLVC